MKMSQHAQQRSQQRAVNHQRIEATLRWGRTFHQRGGRTAYFLGHRDAKRALKHGVDVTRHTNTAVVVAQDETIITVIRTDDPRRLRLRG